MATRKENLILVFYIGTRRIAALVSERGAGIPRVIRFAEMKNAEGFQKGGVSQLDKALQSLQELLRRLEMGEDAVEIPSYVVLSSPYLKMERFSSSIYYSGYPRVVTPHEVRRVIEQTRSVAPLPLDDWVLHVSPESFWVNDLTDVEDPLGLEAQRLAVTLKLFTTNYASFRNLSRLFENLEFNLNGYFPKTLVLPDGVLNANEEEEILIVDFSDGVTHLVLTREGKIIQTASLDVGSRFLTHRVAETWHLGTRDAESLKERFGSLEEGIPFSEELIPLIERGGQENHQIKRLEFHEKFLRFGEELYSQLEKGIKDFLGNQRLSWPCMVVTGGGVRLEGMLEAFGRRFHVPVRLGTPRPVEGASEFLMDSSWAGPVGFLHWLERSKTALSRTLGRENPLERVLVQAKDWLDAYF